MQRGCQGISSEALLGRLWEQWGWRKVDEIKIQVEVESATLSNQSDAEDEEKDTDKEDFHSSGLGNCVDTGTLFLKREALQKEHLQTLEEGP